jgi:hypothetical protein
MAVEITAALLRRLPHPPAFLVSAFARSAKCDCATAASAVNAGIYDIARQVAPAAETEADLINAVEQVINSTEFAFGAVAAAAAEIAADRTQSTQGGAA